MDGTLLDKDDEEHAPSGLLFNSLTLSIFVNSSKLFCCYGSKKKVFFDILKSAALRIIKISRFKKNIKKVNKIINKYNNINIK